MVNIDIFREQIEAVGQTEHGRVIGSIGRMATFQEELQDPFIEFHLRELGHMPGQPADLDVIGMTPAELKDIRAINPDIHVDDASFNAPDVRLTPPTDGDEWLIASDIIPTTVSLHKSRFAKTISVVDGISIPTVPARTHALLHELRHRDGKDEISSELLRVATHVGEPYQNLGDFIVTSYFGARLQQKLGQNPERYSRTSEHSND